MNTRALTFDYPQHLEHHRPKHPFLDALAHVKHGQLTLVTPEGERLEFMGSDAPPIAHMKIKDWGVLDGLVARGEIGLAESYIDGRWASDNLADLLTFGLVNAPYLQKFFYGQPWYIFTTHLRQMFKRNSVSGSRRNIMSHYDLGNEFYKLWLDQGMTYSSALFEQDFSRTLEEAQAAKYRRILRKIDARRHDHILDIGCGWGAFAEAAAREGIRVTGVTLSEEQAHYARERIAKAKLQQLADIRLADYRELTGIYDHIVSIGMFEHVGERYWHSYFERVKRLLKPGGNALIQCITLDDEVFETQHDQSGFIEQVIFPGGMLPSRSRFLSAASDAHLTCHEIFTFGGDYARTCEEWLIRFHKNKDAILALGYDESFVRLWRFYLSACIAAFTSGRTSVMQAKLKHTVQAR